MRFEQSQQLARRYTLLAGIGLMSLGLSCGIAAAEEKPFEIQVLDDQTGRGVPLVELETTNALRFVTDSAGRIALDEPLWPGQEFFFSVRSHGHQFNKDGFGFAGARIVIEPGGRKELRITRLNVAERLYRITGEGIYRDSQLLGRQTPLDQALFAPFVNAGVVGQDSAQAAMYQGQIYWTWGDTSLTRYPLGNFRSAGATSELPGKGGLDPSVGVNLDYFKDEKGYSRPVCPLEKNEGVVWLDGLVTVPDDAGRERLVAHFARMKSLGEMLEHGIVVWNDDQNLFERAATLPLEEKWRFPHGHPLLADKGTDRYVYCGNSSANVRVPATLASVLDPRQYEAWTCLETDDAQSRPARTERGELAWSWQRERRPTQSADEQRWLQASVIKPPEPCSLPRDVETGDRIALHGGSVRFNRYRQRYVMIAVQSGGRSFLGEVWYAEATSPQGPWPRARRVVTHDKYSFYNPVHHDFFDQQGGRLIYFEGTYTHTFSGNPVPTPRYDYNQVMYRLDVDDPRLHNVRGDDD
jgi:hypothetical protein